MGLLPTRCLKKGVVAESQVSHPIQFYGSYLYCSNSGLFCKDRRLSWPFCKAPSQSPLPVLPALIDTANPGKLHTIPIPVARCYTYSWNQDSFGKGKLVPDSGCPILHLWMLCIPVGSPNTQAIGLVGGGGTIALEQTPPTLPESITLCRGSTDADPNTVTVSL